MHDVLELLLLILIFIGILGLCYFVTKKMAVISKGANRNKNMEIIEVLPLLQGHYLYIVKVGKSYHMVGVSAKGSITYCKEVNKEELKLEENQGSESFKEQLSEFMKGIQVKRNDKK